MPRQPGSAGLISYSMSGRPPPTASAAPLRSNCARSASASSPPTMSRLSGWVHRKRDHGQLLFIDLRDHYGVTQCVIDVSSPLFAEVDALRLESVVSFTGRITARTADTVNPNLATGEVELVVAELEVL